MSVPGGYKESDNQNLAMVRGVARRGHNFHCPDLECVAVFDSEEQRAEHLEAGIHFTELMGTKSTADRVKASFIHGMSKQVEKWKLGNIKQIINCLQIAIMQ